MKHTEATEGQRGRDRCWSRALKSFRGITQALFTLPSVQEPGVCRSEDVHSLTAGLILHSTKKDRCSTIQPTNCVVVLVVSFGNLYEEKENPAVLRDEASFILSVLPTLCLISACKTASVLDSRDRWLPQVNGGDDETPFTTVLLYLLTLVTCIEKNHCDFSEFCPRKQHLSL